MRRLRLALVGAVVCPALAGAQELPRMDPGKPILCLEDGAHKRWRVQCDEAAKVCLMAPDRQLDEEGNWTHGLERAAICQNAGAFDVKALEARGFRLKRAMADAPYGWIRDERGRVFQVNFDLHRRLYVGGSWAPASGPDGRSVGRSAVDFGLFVYDHWASGGDTRQRLRLVEGETRLAPFSADVVLAHWDLSHRYANPLLRITTFFDRPRRTDFQLNVGAWVEAGAVELHEAPAGDEALWRFATLHGTIDLWQSRDLDSVVRARGGVGFERTYAPAAGGGDRDALTPGGALEADVTLDRDGFHHITAETGLEVPWYYGDRTLVGRRGRRARAEVGYEAILLAINDQPLSVRLAAGASRRDDIPGLPEKWAFTANAGLRFSLWAPARRQ